MAPAALARSDGRAASTPAHVLGHQWRGGAPTAYGQRPRRHQGSPGRRTARPCRRAEADGPASRPSFRRSGQRQGAAAGKRHEEGVSDFPWAWPLALARCNECKFRPRKKHPLLMTRRRKVRRPFHGLSQGRQDRGPPVNGRGARPSGNGGRDRRLRGPNQINRGSPRLTGSRNGARNRRPRAALDTFQWKLQRIETRPCQAKLLKGGPAIPMADAKVGGKRDGCCENTLPERLVRSTGPHAMHSGSARHKPTGSAFGR